LALLFCSWLSPNIGSTQIMLYLEDMTKVDAIKIYQGSSVWLKTQEIPEWTKYKMERLLDESGVIVHPQGYINIKDITHIRLERYWVTLLGNSLQTFGAAWGVYGLIAAASGLQGVTLQSVAIGSLVPLAVGYIMKKIWKWKKYKIGKKNRLKILDLSLPDDPYGEKEKKVKYMP